MSGQSSPRTGCQGRTQFLTSARSCSCRNTLKDMEDPESSARSSLRRSGVIYAVLLIADLLVISYIVAGATSGGAFVTLSVVGVVGLLLAYQVVQHIRDLNAPLAESVGVVQRMWSRSYLINAMQTYYLTVHRAVCR